METKEATPKKWTKNILSNHEGVWIRYETHSEITHELRKKLDAALHTLRTIDETICHTCSHLAKEALVEINEEDLRDDQHI